MKPPGTEPALGPASHFWLHELRAWLFITKDSRLVINARGNHSVAQVSSASADFCRFLARLTEAGYEARDWRNHWKRFT